MKVRSMLASATVLAAVALIPSRASAQADPCVGKVYSYVQPIAGSGLGASLQGCFQFTLTELGENSALIENQYYWNGNFLGSSGVGGNPSNAPITNPGTFFFTNDCGADGYEPSSHFQFCTGSLAKSAGPITNLSGELVLGLRTLDFFAPLSNGGNDYYQYSGASTRNAFPAPTGYQAVLYQVINGPPNEFLFAWEDLNSGCLAMTGSLSNPNTATFDASNLNNKAVLDDPNNCNPPSAGGIFSDSDYNDSYILLNIIGTPQSSLTPEPMTMSLMAMGLVGMAGASVRRRRNKKN